MKTRKKFINFVSDFMTLDDECMNRRMLRVDGKSIMEQYLQAVLTNGKDSFVEFYSKIDELYVSDVKCWVGKQNVQREFLKVAQILQENNKLVCLIPYCEMDVVDEFDQQLKNLVKDY